MSKASESRNKICEAAIAVAARDGFSSMSLDAVAAEAGVSKGGLLYHFGTKEELMHGTLQHFAEVGQHMLLGRIASDPNSEMRWARGIVSCMFPSDAELETTKQELDPSIIFKFMLSMLTLAADRSTSIGPLTEMGTELRDRLLEDESVGLEQMLIWLAIDGLLVWQLLGLIDPKDELFARVGNEFRSRVGLSPREDSKEQSTKSKKTTQRTKRRKEGLK
ncbi:TetR/AcrR family transcriptional regulator [Gimesia aquarii]|uniref:HTH-type transcriptional regulator SrpR n=1 Tax=Gimesia aquarii TaxID=2527964 RepID=A0A517WQH0_9PLAN|nr:TetR/AcrR family transcriptional regulator [Gimesia aquarii]QDU07500.1 HTH-type transcriptional regulator SrpR [Gimesia aquarii]